MGIGTNDRVRKEEWNAPATRIEGERPEDKFRQKIKEDLERPEGRLPFKKETHYVKDQSYFYYTAYRNQKQFFQQLHNFSELRSIIEIQHNRLFSSDKWHCWVPNLGYEFPKTFSDQQSRLIAPIAWSPSESRPLVALDISMPYLSSMLILNLTPARQSQPISLGPDTPEDVALSKQLHTLKYRESDKPATPVAEAMFSILAGSNHTLFEFYPAYHLFESDRFGIDVGGKIATGISDIKTKTSFVSQETRYIDHKPVVKDVEGHKNDYDAYRRFEASLVSTVPLYSHQWFGLQAKGSVSGGVATLGKDLYPSLTLDAGIRADSGNYFGRNIALFVQVGGGKTFFGPQTTGYLKELNDVAQTTIKRDDVDYNSPFVKVGLGIDISI